MLARVASFAALAPPTLEMASSTASMPMYTPTHLLSASLSDFRRSTISSMAMCQLPINCSDDVIRYRSVPLLRQCHVPGGPLGHPHNANMTEGRPFQRGAWASRSCARGRRAIRCLPFLLGHGLVADHVGGVHVLGKSLSPYVVGLTFAAHHSWRRCA